MRQKSKKRILLNELFGRERIPRKSKNDKICVDCHGPNLFSNSLSCIKCLFEILAEKQKLTETRSKIQTLSRKLFKGLQLQRQEITRSKGRIYTVDYDIEVSDIENQRGHIIYWSATCCHGLKENGPDRRSLYEFWQTLRKQKKEVIIRAHNGIRFDLTFTWKKIIEEELKEKKLCKVWGDWDKFQYRNLTFLDTYNIFSCALEKWPCSKEQKEIKEEGLEMWKSEEYKTINYTEEFYKKLAKYCDNDVQMQKQNMDQLHTRTIGAIEKITGKKFERKANIHKRATKASLGLYILKHIVPEDKFKEWWPNFSHPSFDEQREFWQKAYHGADNDLWNEQKLPKEHPVYSYDVVSMYPEIMRNNPLPIDVGEWVNGIKQDQLEQLKDTGAYQIKVTKTLKLKTELCEIPLIKLFNEKGVKEGRVEVPAGITMHYTGAEWKFIAPYYEGEWWIPRGLEHKSETGLFKEFVDHFANEKLKSKNGEFDYLFSKYMLNSLTGRFGLKLQRRNYELVRKQKNPRKGEAKFLDPNQKIYWQWKLGEEKRVNVFSYVPVSAMITSWARIKLWKAVIANQKNVLYWDTDSIYSKQEIILPEGQQIGYNLGDWMPRRIEYEWEANASKWYRTSETVRTKGLRKASQAQLTWNDKQEKVPHQLWRVTEYGVIIQLREKAVALPKNNPKRKLIKGIWIPRNGKIDARYYA